LQAIAFVSALLGKTGTLADGLPRSFNSYKRQQRQLQQQQLQQQQQEGADTYDFQDSDGDDAAAAGNEAVVLRWPILVVAPTSVLDNWVAEFSKWGLFKVGDCSCEANKSNYAV
jgi:hypothetical protein